MKDSPTDDSKPAPTVIEADFHSLSAACSETFPVLLAVGGELVPDERRGHRREGAKLMRVQVRRLTAEESGYVAELLELAVPQRVKDPQTGEDRYDVLDAEFKKRQRELQWLARAWILIRCVPLLKEGWDAHRQSQSEPGSELTLGPLEKRRPAINAAGRWLAAKLPEDVLERLRAAAESDSVDEEALEGFFSSGS